MLLGTALAVALIIKTFVAQAFFIPSESMLPQLEVGDRIVVSKLSYRLHDPNRGDVVVFDDPMPEPEPSDPLPERVLRGIAQAIGIAAPSTDEFVKRVIALPGETVEGRDGLVYVNGREVVEPYLSPGTATAPFDQVTVPPDTLWVMGDNRSNSADSRSFGPIRQDTVVGRVVFRVWPVTDVSFL